MTRDDVVNKACSYIKDTPYDNPNDITRWFWGNNIAHAWCGGFVAYIIKHDLGSDMLDRCTTDKYVGGMGYVPSIVKWAKDNGYWSTKGQKGDLVIYNWNPENKGGLSHVGIVCEANDKHVISVDGNTVNDKYDHDCVSKRTRNLKYVVGYVNLPYPIKPEEPKDEPKDEAKIIKDFIISAITKLIEIIKNLFKR